MTDPSDKGQTDHLLEAIGLVLLLFFLWSLCGVRPGQILPQRQEVTPKPPIVPVPGEVIEAEESGWFKY